MLIDDFRGEYSYLSNFYKSPVRYQGLVYPCAENAFQAAKCPDHEVRIRYTVQNNPVRAKMMGKKEKLPPNWDGLSVHVMEDILRIKFSDPSLARLLISTGDAELVEGNRWHDNKWGKCRCDKCRNKEAQNLLGKLLMKIRQEFIETPHTYIMPASTERDLEGYVSELRARDLFPEQYRNASDEELRSIMPLDREFSRTINYTVFARSTGETLCQVRVLPCRSMSGEELCFVEYFTYTCDWSDDYVAEALSALREKCVSGEVTGSPCRPVSDSSGSHFDVIAGLHDIFREIKH